ncbi:hypothetical protein SLNSH_10935 [Alsobacter soli]|uniref:Uncharacterized protein n=1 Tax=Alsobacter soli TaxID=2109933 RepID=A0A2T1HTI1_9HYPH|nr:hypothetical protein [Alsobacter soli]PSC04956.1 hypothetical protein SLNSH_10935 [Alsobacter soli]
MPDDWTLETVQALKKMAEQREPASAISMKLGMDLTAVRAKLLQLGFAPAPDVRDGDAGESAQAARPDGEREQEQRLHTL